MTLLEALVVIAVTVLVGGLIFPAMQRSLPRLGAGQALTGFAADLRQARATAVREGRPRGVSVAADGAGYVAEGRARPLPPGVRLAPAGAGVVFQADGSSRGGVFAVSGARAAEVAVDGATGAVTLR